MPHLFYVFVLLQKIFMILISDYHRSVVHRGIYTHKTLEFLRVLFSHNLEHIKMGEGLSMSEENPETL